MTHRRFVLILVLALFWPAAVGAETQSAYDLFQRAATAERARGDLEAAIDLYERVVELPGVDRLLAARALFQIGTCYERLGREQARASYSRVIEEFSDQGEIVALAHERLDALVRPEAEAVARAPATTDPVAVRLLSQDEMTLNNFYYMHPSPDGRRVAYSALGSHEGGLYVRDLETGETTRLPEKLFTLSPIWSPDGSEIAYISALFEAGDGTDAAIRVIGVESQKSRELLRIENQGLDRLLDWSPDGRWLLADLEQRDETFSLVLIEAATGKSRSLVTEGWNQGASATFSPDGRQISFSGVEDDDQAIFLLAIDGSSRRRLTSEPGSERSPLWSPDGTTIVYQREDGVWALEIDNGRPRGAPRLLASTPIDQPLDWSREGGFTYVSYNEVFDFYRLPVDADTGQAVGEVERIGVDLERSSWMRWSPDMGSIAFSGRDGKLHLLEVEDRSVRSFTLGHETRFVSGLGWSHDGRQVVFIPSRGRGPVTARALDPADGTIRDLFPSIGPAERFDISRDGKKMVFYKGDRYARVLTVAALGTAEGRALASDRDPEGQLSNWVRPALSPDGTKVLFGRHLESASSLWVVGTDGSHLRELASVRSRPSKDGQDVDNFLHFAVWSPSGRHVAYNDSVSLFVVTVETGARRALPLPRDLGWISVQQWAPDGKSIALGTHRSRHELWRIRNLLGPGTELGETARR